MRQRSITPRRTRSQPDFQATRLSLRGSRHRLLADGGGAAIVEFALAIMPVLILFFGMVQWTILAYVNLLVHHAAVVAARAEAVMLPQMPDNDGATGTTTDLEKAITPLFAHVVGVGSVLGLGNLSVSIPTPATNICDQTPNTVKVTLRYPCSVPLGNAIACGGLASEVGEAVGVGYFKTLTASASFPNQGSYYQTLWSSSTNAQGQASGIPTCTAAGK